MKEIIQVVKIQIPKSDVGEKHAVEMVELAGLEVTPTVVKAPNQ